MRKGFGLIDSVFIALFLYLFILQIQAIWPFTIDDMYISLRYSRHWVVGDGLLWNVHAPPVEGYSNFSFVVLGAIALLLSVDPVFVLKAAGVIGLFFTCVFLFFISRFWFEKRLSLLPCIGLLLYKGQIIWAASGLESSVYEALICGSIYFVFKGLGYEFFPHTRGEPKFSFFIWAGFLLSLAGMTRPEAPALIALLFLLMCWDKPKLALKKHWQGMALFTLPLMLIYLPYFIWRWHYYGLIFPNSVYCKSFSSDFSALLDINYLKFIWPFAVFALPAGILSKDKRLYFLLFPSFIYLLMLLSADPVVAFDNRLFLPAFALLLPLTLLGISDAILLCLKQRDYVYCLSLYIASFCFALFFIPWMTLADYRYFSKSPIEGEQLRKRVIQWLSKNTASGDSVVLADSGMIPYYSDLNFIDSYCLNNALMSQYPKKHRYALFCNQMLLAKPKIIILTSLIENGKVIYTPSDVRFKVLLTQQSGYKLSETFSSKDPDSIYRYELFTQI